MLLKTGTYAGGGGLGRVGDPLRVGATWRKCQPSGVWASFPDVGMWEDMFLLFLELAQKGDAPHLGISSPPKRRLRFSSSLPQNAEVLFYVLSTWQRTAL